MMDLSFKKDGASLKEGRNAKVKSMLSRREGLVLYWCEGDKTVNANMVSITCAEPSMLRSFIEWLCEYYEADKSKIKLRLHLWRGSDEKKAIQFWSKALGMPKQNFHKTWFKTRSGSKKKYPFGICRVAYYAKRTLLQILNEIKKEFLTPLRY